MQEHSSKGIDKITEQLLACCAYIENGPLQIEDRRGKLLISDAHTICS